MIYASATSAEFGLVAACCRWPPAPARDEAVRAAAAGAIDWDRVERITCRHRVFAHVRHALAGAGIPVPDATARRLAEEAQKARMGALAMVRESILLQDAFDAAGCPVLFVKGASLAMLAYGDPGFKWSWDIDLLTTPEAAARGREILEARGYKLIQPWKPDTAAFGRFLSLGKEAVFIHPETRIAVELHWKLVDNPCLLTGIDARSPTQPARVGGRELRTLRDAELLAYLMAHGTRHAWSRLKWLADVGALVASHDAAAIEPLYRRLQTLETGRAAAVALLLCHELLGIAMPPELLAELRSDRATLRLRATALAALTHGRGEREVTTYSIPGFRTLISHFEVAPGWLPFAAELKAKWQCPADRMAIPLPRPLWFLYDVLRIPLWVIRRSGIALRALKRPAASDRAVGNAPAAKAWVDSTIRTRR